MNISDPASYTWTDHPANPLLEPPRPEWLLGDPTVLAPEESPDGRWHMLANTLRGIHHFVSGDGVRWGLLRQKIFPGMRVFFVRGERFAVVYEHFFKPWRTAVALRRSEDLESWSEPTILLQSELPWEGRWMRNCSCPCAVKTDTGYRLYYSAASVLLRDCKFPEPRHIGVAEAPRLEGPYTKRVNPILSPAPDNPYRNWGAGSFKAYRIGGKWVGFNNGIYLDSEKRSRSAIALMHSKDGIFWEPVHEKPFLMPEPGWKSSLVYAFDVVEREEELRIYYNARDGWFRGSERIGLAIGRPK